MDYHGSAPVKKSTSFRLALQHNGITMDLSKMRYFLSSAAQRASSFAFRCTNCGSDEYMTADNKYLVTALRRCKNCQLMYRVPPDSDHENFDFYQKAYRQGFTTEVPSEEILEQLIATKFAGTQKCYRAYISVLRQLGLESGARIFDYGCSWGYGSWQLMDCGYRVT